MEYIIINFCMDALTEEWIKLPKNSPFKNFYFIKESKEENQTSFIKKVKCECGAEKCKTTHAKWCPKFNLTNK